MYVAFPEVLGAMLPLLTEWVTLITEELLWSLSLDLTAFVTEWKSFNKKPRWSMDSYDRYMAWTHILT
jgi:hypothetical protein